MKKIHYTDINLNTKTYSLECNKGIYKVVTKVHNTFIGKHTEINGIVKIGIGSSAYTWYFSADKDGYLEHTAHIKQENEDVYIHKYLTEEAAREQAKKTIISLKEQHQVKLVELIASEVEYKLE